MNIKHIDHIVLTVRDIEKTIQFYETILGMKKDTFGDGRVALKFGNQKINLHLAGKELEPKANSPTPGSADICFITETDLNTVLDYVKNKGIHILEGPANRIGAAGHIVSLYFRDPDGNLIEISNYMNT